MSVRQHFIAKLGANLVGLAVNVATVAFVPRMLGPDGYGRYEFLSNFFLQVRNLADMGTSTCFYTRLSQRPWDVGLIRFYRNLVLAGSSVVITVAATLSASQAGERLFAGESVTLVMLAALFGCLTWWVDSIRKVVDAYRLTTEGEFLYAASRVATFVGLLLGVAWMGIGLSGYFVYQIVTGLLVGTLLIGLTRQSRREAANRPGTHEPPAGYWNEFWSYSHPLILFAVVSAGIGIAERWLLQTQAGSEQQGYYGLAYQVGAACFLFTSAMTQVLMREFSTAWQQDDVARMRGMFGKIIPLLYLITAYFCVFASCRSRDVAYVVGGSDFEHGAVAMSLLVLYPMHQTYGQLSGSVFFATGATALYRNIGVVGVLAGLPLVYVLVASPAAGGLGLGAVGLAAKTLALQFVLVNVQLWFNSRLLGLAFWTFVRHQIAAPAALAAAAFGSSAVIASLSLPRVADLIASGVLYTVATIALVCLAPRFVGVDREEIMRLTKLLSFRRMRSREDQNRKIP